jgi:hypothetical protein
MANRSLNVRAYNANGTERQRYELSKEMQDLHTEETHLKSHKRFFIHNYNFYRIDRCPGIKGGTAVAVRKGIPHSHVDLPPLISIEAAGICIPTGNSAILLAAVYKSPCRACSDASIIELLCVRGRCTLVGDLNAKHQFWNSRIPNSSGGNI